MNLTPNRPKALMLAKRQLSELVCDAVNLEARVGWVERSEAQRLARELLGFADAQPNLPTTA